MKWFFINPPWPLSLEIGSKGWSPYSVSWKIIPMYHTLQLYYTHSWCPPNCYEQCSSMCNHYALCVSVLKHLTTSVTPVVALHVMFSFVTLQTLVNTILQGESTTRPTPRFKYFNINIEPLQYQYHCLSPHAVQTACTPGQCIKQRRQQWRAVCALRTVLDKAVSGGTS